MPLNETISFKATLQKGGRVQVPRSERWFHKMEPDQAMTVIVKPDGSFEDGEVFHSRMSKDGRITIPKRTIEILENDSESLEGHVLKIVLHPDVQES